jgi:uncharacterized protein (DUF1499 family)
MKIILIIALALVSIVSIYFFYLGYQSRTQQAPTLGIKNNNLTACPSTPNCVSSELGTDLAHTIAPFNIPLQQTDTILADAKAAIIFSGGEIKSHTDSYLYATFKTKLFQFVDDFEIRVDKEQNLLHFRSASRVGKSDFGANKKRVTAVIDQLAKKV